MANIHFQGTPAITSGANAAPLRLLNKDEWDQLVAFREAGLHGDRTEIPETIAVLKSSSSLHPEIISVALGALARLGATEAVPIFDDIIAKNKTEDLGDYARVAKARLLAEDKAKQVKGSSGQAQLKIDSFYQTLGTTPAALNSAASHSQINANYNNSNTGTNIYAMREIADMEYHGVYSDYAALPKIKQLQVTTDVPTKLKMSLAPLSNEARVQTLIEDLAQTKYLDTKERLEIQLASDEGLSASNAAAKKLREMEAHRDQYSKTGFEALLGVLDVTGDVSQIPLVKHFMGDSDPYIAYYAKQVYPAVQSGKKSEASPLY